MAEDKTEPKAPPSAYRPPPPPFDPFPTYASPFPRPPRANGEEDDNPFIQFRRFADQQFATLFQSLGIDFSDWNARQSHDAKQQLQKWQERAEEMNTRHVEGVKKQREQEMEEMRRMKEAFHRGRTVEGAKFPDILVPSSFFAWPSTELELYEEQEPTRPARDKRWGWGASCQRRETEQPNEEAQEPQLKKASAGKSDWFTLGYDGRRRMASKAELEKEHQKLMKRAIPYSTRSSRRLDPIGNPDHTVPWLLINPYSPLYVCNPSSERLVGAFFAQSPQGTLNVLRPWYMQRVPSSVDEQLARRLPWADAFEDLISLENKGKMEERNFSTWRTPDDWVLGMAARGNLKGWEVNDEGNMVRTKDANSRCGRDRKKPQWGFSRCKNKRRQQEAEKEAELSAAEPNLPPLSKYPEEWYKSETVRPESLTTEFWHTPDAVTDAIRRAEESQRIEEIPERESRKEVQIPEPATSSNPSFFSSSSSSSWSRSSRDSDEADSMVSTMTTTERTTMPDGSVETKRVLKKKFADGREESTESVERENSHRQTAVPSSSSSRFSEQWAKDMSSEPSVGNKKVQTVGEQANTPEKSQRKSGWFWY